MADNNLEVKPEATPVAETAPAAPVEPSGTPVVAPEATKVESPAPTEIPVETAPEAPEAKVEPTVLGEEPPKEPVEAKKEEQPQKEEVKAEETKTETEPTEKEDNTEGQSEEPAPPPVYEPFTLPEGVNLEAERLKEFTDILSDFEVNSKADHALVQQLGQKAIDLYMNEVKKAQENLTTFYQDVWEKQKTDWKDAFLADPEIGGNRFRTTVDSALNFIRTHGGTAEQQAEFRELMNSSGLGNHPAMIRLLANANRFMSEGKPLAAQKPVPAQKSKVATMYGKTTN